jgi:sulfate transport system ATP-binding protein
VFVTHDQDEALEVADRVVVMNDGVIEQVGTPEAVYDHPASPFVYSFLGDVNLFHPRLEAGRARIGGHEVEAPEWSEAPDSAALAYVRTYEVDLAPTADGTPAMGAIVRRVRRLGSVVRLELDREEDGKVIEAELTRRQHEELGVVKGDRVFVSPRRARVFLEPG